MESNQVKKKHLINLAYLGVKLKKTLAITWKFMCQNIQTEDKKSLSQH